MTSKMWSRHPASIILQWYVFAEKDEEGYASLSLLLECLENKCGIKSRVFLERISSKKWQKNYGWRLKFHSWKPNRIKLVKDGDCKERERQAPAPSAIITSEKRFKQVEAVSFAPQALYARVLRAGRGNKGKPVFHNSLKKAQKNGKLDSSPAPPALNCMELN